MKTYLQRFLFFVVLWSSALHLCKAQSSGGYPIFYHYDSELLPAGLYDRVDAYLRLFYEGEYEETLDYVHPSLFDLFPKSVLAGAMSQTFDAPGIRVTFDTTMHTAMSGPVEDDSTRYVRMDYRMSMYMTFSDSLVDSGNALGREEYGSDYDMLGFLVKVMALQVGEEYVKLDRASSTVFMNPPKTFFAIQDKKDGSPWYFLSVEENMKSYIDKIIPGSIQGMLRVE